MFSLSVANHTPSCFPLSPPAKHSRASSRVVGLAPPLNPLPQPSSWLGPRARPPGRPAARLARPRWATTTREPPAGAERGALAPTRPPWRRTRSTRPSRRWRVSCAWRGRRRGGGCSVEKPAPFKAVPRACSAPPLFPRLPRSLAAILDRTRAAGMGRRGERRAPGPAVFDGTGGGRDTAGRLRFRRLFPSRNAHCHTQASPPPPPSLKTMAAPCRESTR